MLSEAYGSKKRSTVGRDVVGAWLIHEREGMGHHARCIVFLPYLHCAAMMRRGAFNQRVPLLRLLTATNLNRSAMKDLI